MTEPKRDDDTPVTFLEWLGLNDSPNFAKNRWLGGVVSVALSLLLTLALFAAVVALVRSFTAAEAGLGTGGLIVALLGAPFLIWSTVLKHQTLRYQKEGHITDRINKAVEQLGAEKTVKVPSADGDKSIERSEPNIEVRIGAILSLERIAQDSTKHDKGRDHVRVMEILCAYVRHNAPRAKDDNGTDAPPQRLDIQKALDVIKRRGRSGRDLEAKERYRLDLRETDLRGYDLSRGDFAGAVFWRSNLEAAYFFHADLTGTRFDAANLVDCKFIGAKFRGTRFNFATYYSTGSGYERTFPSARSDNFESISIAGARMQTGFEIDPEFAWRVFGSKDTKHLGSSANAAEVDAEEFAHWSAHDASHRITASCEQSFYRKHGLIGWPFDD